MSKGTLDTYYTFRLKRVADADFGGTPGAGQLLPGRAEDVEVAALGGLEDLRQEQLAVAAPRWWHHQRLLHLTFVLPSEAPDVLKKALIREQAQARRGGGSRVRGQPSPAWRPSNPGNPLALGARWWVGRCPCGGPEPPSRLPKRAHLRRWRARALAATYPEYASLGTSRAALHLDPFGQPGRGQVLQHPVDRLPKRAHLRRWRARAALRCTDQVRLAPRIARRLASGPF